LFQADETPKRFGSAPYERLPVRPSGALELHLTLRSLERVVRSLLPFYGVNCPVAIYDEAAPERPGIRATLGAIEGWEPPHQSLFLVIG
jgi:hypothetical protein